MEVPNFNPDYFNMGIFVVCLMALISAASGVVTIWYRVKRQPTIEKTLEDYVKREDFKKHEEDDRLSRNKIDRDIRDMRQKQSAGTREIFKEIRRMNENIDSKISKLNTSINEEFKDVNKSIGRLEGELKKKE